MPGRGGGPGGFGGALVARCIRLAVPFDVDSAGPFGTVSDGFIDWLDAMEDKFVAVLDGPSGCWGPLSEITASFLGGRSWSSSVTALRLRLLDIGSSDVEGIAPSSREEWKIGSLLLAAISQHVKRVRTNFKRVCHVRGDLIIIFCCIFCR